MQKRRQAVGTPVETEGFHVEPAFFVFPWSNSILCQGCRFMLGNRLKCREDPKWAYFIKTYNRMS